MTTANDDLDPVILDAVRNVANRFGATGLEDLIMEAQRELDEVLAALTDLGDDAGGS